MSITSIASASASGSGSTRSPALLDELGQCAAIRGNDRTPPVIASRTVRPNPSSSDGCTSIRAPSYKALTIGGIHIADMPNMVRKRRAGNPLSHPRDASVALACEQKFGQPGAATEAARMRRAARRHSSWARESRKTARNQPRIPSREAASPARARRTHVNPIGRQFERLLDLTRSEVRRGNHGVGAMACERTSGR